MYNYNEKLFNLYNSFENGYEFEIFLKKYFENLGLNNVSVTQKSHDGGIDLIGYHDGIDNVHKIDQKKYIIQAKRYMPNESIGVSVIRELKGVLNIGEVGIVITTGKFSNDAITESSNNVLHPIILIDGLKLIRSCNFNFDINDSLKFKNYDLFGNNNIISTITVSEISNGLLLIPNDFIKYIPENMKSIKVIINDLDENILQYDDSKKAFINMGKIFEKYKIKDENTIHVTARIKWKYCNGMIFINIDL